MRDHATACGSSKTQFFGHKRSDVVPTHKFDPGDVVVSRARDVTDPPHEAELGTGVRQPHDPVVHAHLAKKGDRLEKDKRDLNQTDAPTCGPEEGAEDLATKVEGFVDCGGGGGGVFSGRELIMQMLLIILVIKRH